MVEQEVVAELGGRLGIGGSGGAVEHGQHAFAAAIGDFVEDGSVALRGISRFQDVEIGGEFDQAGGVDGGFVDVGDDLVGGEFRIDGEIGFADQALVGARGAEGIFPPSTSDFSEISIRTRAAGRAGARQHARIRMRLNMTNIRSGHPGGIVKLGAAAMPVGFGLILLADREQQVLRIR